MKIWKLSVLLAGLLFVSACNTTNTTDITETESTSQVSVEIDSSFTEEDYDDSFDESATEIELNATSASINGKGASMVGNALYIGQSGTYVLSGDFDGQVLINCEDSGTVRVVLNGVNISYSENSAIYASSSSKVVLILADGTENYVEDGTAYIDSEIALTDDDPNAAIYIKDDLSITGSGNLTVISNIYHGVVSKDSLKVTDGNLNITAVKTALRGRDSALIAGGSFNLSAGTNALHSNNDSGEDKGYIIITAGDFVINSDGDGIQAETTLTIAGGTFDVTTNESSTATSYKGLKSNGDLVISGGEFVINSADDAVHSNANVTVDNANFTIETGDDGFHADEDTTINSGTINIVSSYEGIEGSNVYINGGEILVNSTDDAVNAAGGSSDSGMGRFGADSFGGSGDYSINVTGGSIIAIAGGDCFDSNGDINISGGHVEAYVNSSADNEAMDCDGNFNLTGGTVIYGGTGGGGTDTSTQSYVALTNVTKDQTIIISKDQTEILSFAPQIDCKYLTISTPDMVNDETYSVNIDGTTTSVIAGTGAQEGMMGGMQGGGMGNRENRTQNDTTDTTQSDRTMGERPSDMGTPPSTQTQQ